MTIQQCFKKLTTLFILVPIILITGCASNQYTEGLIVSNGYRVTDRDILEFNNHVRHMMRLKMKYATIASYVSSTIAIGTATAATIVTAGGASTVAIAALAGTSAFSSNIMGIFSFSDATIAYQDGVSLMERAEAKYFRQIALNGSQGVIDTTSLSIEAANLYSETVAALALVEKALANRIPTMLEVMQATGHTMTDINSIISGSSQALSSITVTPNRVILQQTTSAKPSKKITFTGDLPIKQITSLNKSVVVISKTETLSATLEGVSSGNADIIILAKNGNTTRVTVDVSSPIHITSVGQEVLNQRIDISKEHTFKITSISPLKIATLSPQGFCTIKGESITQKVEKDSVKAIMTSIENLQGTNGGTTTIKCTKSDIYTLMLTNQFQTTRVLTLNIAANTTE